VVDESEFAQPLSGMFEKTFPKTHPELMHHFVEYNPARVPRMLSRASHIDDMRAPMLESLAEATQIGAGEFYQIFSDQMQANYPVTAGLMPWVFKRPWPVIAIMLVDGFGQPTAPYYFLKRTYEPTHVLLRLPHLIWAPGEELPIALSVTHALPAPCKGLTASVRALDPAFAVKWEQTRRVDLAPGASVAHLDLGQFAIPADFADKFFFVVAELRSGDGRLVSRSVYWPRCLSKLADAAFREKYRSKPQPTLTLTEGPWLKPQTAAHATRLEMTVLSHARQGADGSLITVRIKNQGQAPAFNTRVAVEGADRAFYASDNHFWLPAGEERTLEITVEWRGPATKATVAASAWNAAAVERPLDAAR
jgi:beta-mannosidase